MPASLIQKYRSGAGTPYFIIDEFSDLGEHWIIVKGLKTGQQVDQFLIVRKLGQGGMSEVYLARDTRLGRKVALKLIRAELDHSPQQLVLFLNEARLTAKFAHPHIITIYTVGEYQGQPYLALEYLEGQTLRERMHQGVMSAPETMRIGLAIAQALEEAHSHGVLHRDLKPANIIIPQDGRLRVLDFGISKIVGDPIRPPNPAKIYIDEGKPEETAWGTAKGTPNYMSPERWLGEKVTGAADIWALGVILFRLLSQIHPFHSQDGTPETIAQQILSAREVPPLPPEVNVPPELYQLIISMLDREASRRPTAKQVVEALQRLLQRKTVQNLENISPFRGLLPFSERHADLFFGRNAEIQMALERLRHEPILPVVGPSGAGKSSFVSAGIVPRLRELDRWLVLTVRPGTCPFGALSSIIRAGYRGEMGSTTPPASFSAQKYVPKTSRDKVTVSAVDLKPLRKEVNKKEGVDHETTVTMLEKKLLAKDTPRYQGASSSEIEHKLLDSPAKLLLELQALAEEIQGRVLLFVDQLEELYTQEHAPEIRRVYMDAISRAADDSAGPIRVIFTLRDDFLGRITESPSMREAMSHIMVLGAPGEKALYEIVTHPVELAGYSYEDENLPTEMLDAVREASSSLPILQFACSQLWNRRDVERRLLTRTAYQEMGGVEGALASKADELLAGLSEVQQKSVRQLVLRLVTPEGTRRVVAPKELLEGLDSSAALVLERLTAERMVVSRRAVDKGSAEAELVLVHDSLIHSWRPLVRWLEQSREEVVFLDEVSRAAKLWDSRGRPSEEVWSDDALNEARARIKRCEAVPKQVTDFLEAGELQRTIRARVRRKVLLAVFGMLLLVIVILAFIIREVDIQRGRALSLMEEAREQRDRQQQAHASALREGARAAYTKGDFLEARSKLRASLEARDSIQARALWWLLENEPLVWSKSLDAAANNVSVSHDGRLIAVSSRYINIYDTKTLERRVLSGPKAQVEGIDFSPDGRWLSSGSYDGNIRLWDLREGTVKVLRGHTSAAMTTVFSADGKRLASGGLDKTIRIWDIKSGTPIRTLKTENKMYARFSSNGRFIISVSRDDKVLFWNTQNYELEKVIEEPGMAIFDAVTSANGKLLAYGGSDGVLVVRDFETQQELARIFSNSNTLRSLSFSSNDDSVAASTLDGRLLVWDTKTWSLRNQFQHANVSIHSMSFLPGGEQVLSAGMDKMLKLWQMSVHSFQKESVGHSFQIYALAFAPDGKTIATGSSVDGQLLLWDVASGESIRRIHGQEAGIWDITFNHEGSILAAGTEDGTIRLYKVSESKLFKNLQGHRTVVSQILFSPNGTELISSSHDKTIAFWDLESLTLQKSLSLGGRISSIDIDSEGRLLASVVSPVVEVREIKTGQVRQTFSGHSGRIWGVAFSHDGKALYSSSWDHTVRRYQLGSISTKSEVVARHQGFIYWIDVTGTSEDILGTPSADGTAKLWNIKNGEFITLKGHQDEVNRLRFSPDGTRVATVSDDRTLRLWDTKTGRPFWRAPLMLEAQPLLFTQQGWNDLEDDGTPSPSTKRWQKAVEARGKLASATVHREILCIATFGDELEIWDMLNDKQLVTTHYQRIQQVLAIREGCLTRAEETLTLTKASGDRTFWGKQVDAMSRFEDSVFVLIGGKVRVFDLDGNQQDEFTMTAGATALTIVGDTIALGYPDGRIEVWRRDDARSERLFFCRGVESFPVNTIIPGPPGTIIAGYANGIVGIWSIETGERLYTQRLHGPVIHLLHRDRMLWAATELGSRLRIDLSTFYTDYCELMERVWRSVPWIWEEGRARFRERPRDHKCAGRDLGP